MREGLQPALHKCIVLSGEVVGTLSLCVSSLHTECGCHLPGVRNNGDCSRVAVEGVVVGDCSCKNLTMGRTCSQCVPGYFNLTADNSLGCQGRQTGSEEAGVWVQEWNRLMDESLRLE